VKRKTYRRPKVKKRNDGTGPVFAQVHGGVYLPDCLPQVRAIAARGFTDKEICAVYGLNPDLFRAWRKAYPDFNDALEKGRLAPDAAVVESLFKRAVGYDYYEDGLTRTGAIRQVKRHLPGDTGAIRYWLNNRQRDQWKDRSSQEVGGSTEKDAKPIGVKSEGREDMIAAILSLVQPKPDNPPEKATKK
jgi:hypothetical protein